MQERGIELKGDQLPVSAIIRSPLLAIRWQLPSQKVGSLIFCLVAVCLTDHTGSSRSGSISV
jgi:hypothetical protein